MAWWLSIFHPQDQPDLMVKYDLVTENSFNRPIIYSIWILALAIHFPSATSDGVSCLLLLTKGGIPAVTLYCKKKSCALKPLSNKTE